MRVARSPWSKPNACMKRSKPKACDGTLEVGSGRIGASFFRILFWGRTPEIARGIRKFTQRSKPQTTFSKPRYDRTAAGFSKRSRLPNHKLAGHFCGGNPDCKRPENPHVMNVWS